MREKLKWNRMEWYHWNRLSVVARSCWLSFATNMFNCFQLDWMRVLSAQWSGWLDGNKLLAKNSHTHALTQLAARKSSLSIVVACAFEWYRHPFIHTWLLDAASMAINSDPFHLSSLLQHCGRIANRFELILFGFFFHSTMPKRYAIDSEFALLPLTCTIRVVRVPERERERESTSF